MNGSYEMSRYGPEHKSQVAELQKELWSSDTRLNTAYLEWKYEQNPYLDIILIYLVWHRGELVAMRGFYGSLWEAGRPRRQFPIYCADDLVIATGHRNRGLFTRINKAAFEDLPADGDRFAVTLSGGPTTVLGSLTMGWKSIGVTQQVRRESSGAVLARQARRVIGAVPVLRKYSRCWPAPWERDQFARLDARAARASSAAGGVRLAREPNVDAMADLVEALGTDGRIRHVRNATYFAWRFRNPMHEYRFLYAGESRLTGYLVLRRAVSDRFDQTSAYISDWEAGDPGVMEELLRTAIRWGGFSHMIAWAATLPDDARAILERAGFVNTGASARGMPCVLVRPVRGGRPEGEWTIAGRPLLDLASWELRMLYSMAG
ncbi:MAG: hypothetical protein ABJA98_10735 [Acidobacteriota bacterium]